MRQRRIHLLTFVIVCASFAHVAALWALQGMVIESQSPRSSWLQHGLLPSQDLGKAREVKDLKRKEDLEAFLEELLQQPLEKVRIDNQKDQTVQAPSLEELLPKGEGLRDLASPDLAMENFSMLSQEPSASISEVLTEIEQEQNQALGEELLQATQMSSGEVLVDDLSSVKDQAGLKLGLSLPIIRKQRNFSRAAKAQGASGIAYFEQLPELEEKPLKKAQLPSIASSDDFSVDIAYTPRSDGQGFVFKISFIPRPERNFRRIKQNLFFLIDRSHSIDVSRYELSKKAVLQALTQLNPGDSFNILIFDDSVLKLSEKNLELSEQNIEMARQFLQKQEHGGFFASTDIYASLGKIVPAVVADTEVNTAVLLSDGDTYLGRDKQRRTIAEWTRNNAGRVALFSVASGRGNNLALLELLSFFNKGQLVYAPKYEDLSLVLMQLIDAISTPIGKDIIATAVASNENMQVAIYPYSSKMPNLYEEQAYVLYGSVDKLDDFYIFLQGKYYDNWLDIKQKIQLSKANRVGQELEKAWTVRKAYDHYYRFLHEGRREHLVFAKRLLEPLNIKMAFR